MKKVLSILLALLCLAAFVFFAVASGGSSSGGGSYSDDAKVVGDAFGMSPGDVQNQVDDYVNAIG